MSGVMAGISTVTRHASALFAALFGLFLHAAERPCATIGEARSRGGDSHAFDLTGQVIADENAVLVVSDETGGCRVHPPDDQHGCRPGDVVRVCGRRLFYADSLEIVSRRPLPRPVATTAARIAVGEHDYTFASVTGVVSAVTRDELDPDWNWFVLRTGSGSVSVAVKAAEFPADGLARLVDAAVVAMGVAVPFSSWRRPLGSHLIVSGKAGLVPLAASDDRTAAHRQTVCGRILAATDGLLYLRLRDGRLARARPLSPRRRPDAGSMATVIGFAEDDGFWINLTDALVRTGDGSANALDAVRALSSRQLFTTVNGQVNTDFHGQVIRLTGVVQAAADGPRTFTFACGGPTVTVDLSGLGTTAIPERGSTLDITGLCIAEFEAVSTAASFPRFKGFTLVPRTADDLHILARPPWWTPFKFLCAILTLVALIVLILAWTRTLQVRSEKRGRELAREQLGHAKAELKVEERTRLAVELHDSISQMMTGVSLQIDAARGSLPARANPSRGYLDAARQILASCRHELRCCLWDLRSRTFEEKDLTEAIVRTLQPYAGEASISVRFNVPRDRLSESHAHAVLRIVRELTVNALRHGHAQQVKIAGERHGDVLRFSVKDDGCGFDPATAPGPASGHFGLVGIRERAAEFDGEAEIDSRPGHGTKAVVTLTIQEEIDET